MNRHTRLSALTLAGLLFAMHASTGAAAPTPAARTPAAAGVRADATQSGARVVSLTFKQMGAWSALKLRGVDGSRTLGFTIRADEVVVAARLRIAYDYSPALIPELSHLRVLLNETVAAVAPLPGNQTVGNARDIELDPRLFRDQNELRFNLIGHYTRTCEDPFHSSLWLTLSDLGRLELTLASQPVAGDLKYLPAPFLDKRDNVALKLPFVFAGTPALGTYQAAGVAASWFGMQAGARGARFPVAVGALPDGNAVVVLRERDTLAGVATSALPSLTIQPHPRDPQAKLLVISGATDADLQRAARTLATIAPSLIGPGVTIRNETMPAPRLPYDAPAWIRTDRAVSFGELARANELRVQGYYPEVVRLNYRLPPDLFTWRTPGVPLDLKYRAARLAQHRNSSLGVNLNGNFLDTLALNLPDPKAASVANPANLVNQGLKQQAMFIPPYAGGGRDQLQLAFTFDVIKEGECKNMPPDNLQAAIDPASTVDFSGFPHFTVLPNLGYFAQIGFPFTRMADLSETAVVLSERPNADEVATYLMLMGKMAEATGYPALGHALVGAAGVDQMAERDLIVIGAGASQSLMTSWADQLPMRQLNGERRVRAPHNAWLPAYPWDPSMSDASDVAKAGISLTGNGNLSVLMGLESPIKAGRSAVFLYADRSADLRKLTDLLLDPERIALVHGDFAIVDDKNITTTRVGATYDSGSLPWLSKARWFMADHPLLFAFIVLLACLLLGALLYRPLRAVLPRRAAKIAPLA
jgi:hypothetical protein